MQERIIFREMLSEIKELADQKGNQLTTEEINDFFENAHLTAEQLEMVYEYLNSQKVQVEGYQSKNVSAEAAKKEDMAVLDSETEYASLYQEEIKGVAPISEAEEFELFKQASEGNAVARSHLVKRHLQTVYDLAQTYQISELSISDLVQEGNVALLLAVDELKAGYELSEYRNTLYHKITEAMEAAVMEYSDIKEMDEKIAQRVNHLNEAVQNLEQDLEHKVSVAELSAYLEMPEKEIRDILRMSGSEIELADFKKKN